MSSNINHFYEFKNFRFDPKKKILWRDNEIVSLTPKASEVLSLLVEQHGNLIERDEILEKVWKDTFVEEGNLNHAISALRKTLGGNEIIQTIPRRGYRFTADVREVFDENETNLIIEKHTLSRTLIEETEEIQNENLSLPQSSKSKFRYRIFAAVAFLFIISALSVWYFYSNYRISSLASGNAKKTLAIMPPQSLDKDDEKTLGLGITESLASQLGSLGKIIVRPTNSVKQLAETESDPIEIGQKTKSDVVLTGNLQQSNEHIRVTLRLINVADGSQIWAGTFDENETDIFRLQDSLSAKIADSLIDTLSPQERQQLTKRSTQDAEAYKLYLRGRHTWNKRTPEGLWESIRLFQSAIDRDPTFALAHAGLANAYVLLNDYDAAAPEEAYPKAKAAAYRALEIDPDLAEPRVTLAYVLASYDWNWAEAEGEYRRAIEINPNYATAHQWYGEMLYATKRFAEAEIELKRAAELDPLAPIIGSELAAVAYYAGEYDETIARYSKIKQEYPNFPTSYLLLSWAYEQKQMTGEAFANEIVFWKLQGVDEATLSQMERAFRQEGYTSYLREIAKMLENAATVGRLFHEYRLVHTYGRLRDREKTLEWLEKGVERRSSNVVKVYIDPNFDFLREDARFQAALRKMNFQ